MNCRCSPLERLPWDCVELCGVSWESVGETLEFSPTWLWLSSTDFCGPLPWFLSSSFLLPNLRFTLGGGRCWS